jgi:hypothetical protein
VQKVVEKLRDREPIDLEALIAIERDRRAERLERKVEKPAVVEENP